MGSSKAKRVVTGLAFLLGTAIANGGPVVNLPSDSGVPEYWSGTNCRVHVSATKNAGASKLTSAKLWIGGVLVRDITFPAFPLTVDWNTQIMFDSTHFTEGIGIKVKCTVTDTTGSTTVEIEPENVTRVSFMADMIWKSIT